MELRTRLNPKKVFIGVYFLAFAVWLIVGLQPVGAANYNIVGALSIPEINLSSNVAAVEVENGHLETPNNIVGSYSRADNKTFLFGHSSTVFANLNDLKIGDEINYNGDTFYVSKIDVLPKSEIRMSQLLKTADKNTLVMMTCAGTDLGDGDSTHRLIITASVE